ncbi:Co2+/Mg2+ efflux protein ApaG [Sphingobacterium hungaricum]|uniref:Co2+/Mg2+ efflux protein ApaG n=1 Tax=Sphingobacterium hungaricum TaxID=2082723 RepID=A0A928UY39_9SPHI|nr:Co2+/Mg2+ efflux protein ApaG [Sphingobacterium hungaricum]MBE8712922.1 Co2+/Mg2+ efflux protein ApaG [Sphingobacterium hungaricum]
MTTQITEGVKVSVEATYQSEYSNPENKHFMFAYRITIENLSHFTVQLLNRHWDIFDTIGEYKQVDGEGVVGVQPILNPGEIHQYTSGCNLKSDMGYMEGFYEMKNHLTGETFMVDIPRFTLEAAYLLN